MRKIKIIYINWSQLKSCMIEYKNQLLVINSIKNKVIEKKY